MSDQESKVQPSDAELIELARSGDRGAFGDLWRRHYRPGARVARQITSSIDADDLVSEAYVRIYQRVLAGGGPTGAFRPYLYTTIRNLAASWGSAQSREVDVEAMDEVEDERIPGDPAAEALDRTLTARAFRSLPERWRTVLWYTEIEGMDPHEVAPILGITPNAVAALSYRAREGLRAAWLQAHVNDAVAEGECRWALEHLGGNARGSLAPREKKRLDAHLADCTKCAIISEEVEEVGSHLALVMVPLILGGVVGGAVLAQLAAPGAAMAATIPAVPAAIVGGSTIAASVAGASTTGVASASAATASGAVAAGATATAGAGIFSGIGSLVGGAALVVVIGGAVGLGAVAPSTAQDATGAAAAPSSAMSALGFDSASATPAASAGAGSGDAGSASGSGSAAAGDGAGGTAGDQTGSGGVVGGVVSGVDGVVGGVVGGVVAPVVGGTVDTVNGVVGGAVGAVTPSTAPPGQSAPPTAPVTSTIALNLSGRGTPGATVAAQAAGTVWATTTVGSDGRWALRIDALPTTAGSVAVSQKAGGAIGSVLNLLGITVPLSLDTGGLGVVVNLLN
ncbi:sigma-70 family RNA polymerase sigma factor [Schumannella sp. 10F1B-5-1]|uniref:sigma-70 family RNA polymerase sigma factor n=1 Tax=Schumannella sp. 10F1B-5-1 TaxID=2590780 RepID=UPI0011315161|nr:sigma-70 family RNA polymerase sigma factor [Schumannella sp. 10F1B-5-1]TPW73512.1 sigma-70 family RNA polymerase sigma factor [Schumannella sp. 10F1B-5-1]